MARPDTIGVVTITYNSGMVLQDFLRCLLAQTYQEFVLFVVDNASVDDTMEILRGYTDPRINVIANQDNRGVAEGNNQGIKACLSAGCSSVLLINNDTEFDSTLMEKLIGVLARGHVQMVCPKMMYYDRQDTIWAAGGRFRPWFGYDIVHLGQDEGDFGQYDQECHLTYAPTCCILMAKEVFQVIGLMDERYFVYVDDVDFMYRAMKAGLIMCYLPTATLLHKVGQLTGGEESQFAVRYGTRNRIFFLLKHFGLLRTLPWLLLRQLSWIFAVCARRRNLTWLRRKNAAFLEGLAMYREAQSKQQS